LHIAFFSLFSLFCLLCVLCVSVIQSPIGCMLPGGGLLMVSLQPLGDQAVLASCADEKAALRLSSALRRAAPPWLIDVVQAYTSVAAFFDAGQTGYAAAAAFLDTVAATADRGDTVAARVRVIPCCYEYQLDLERVARHTGLSADEVIRLHTAM